jgi:hypothetical protein
MANRKPLVDQLPKEILKMLEERAKAREVADLEGFQEF